MGHALNKVLKDIVCRYKIMQGFNVRYAARNCVRSMALLKRNLTLNFRFLHF